MAPAPLDLELNPSLGIPIYRQIMDAIRRRIAGGLLKPGDRLPSLRELCGQLRINPASAIKAYTELQHEGTIVLDQGRGTFVSDSPAVVETTRDQMLRDELTALLQRARTLGFSTAEVRSALDRVLAGTHEEKRRKTT